MIVGWDDWSDVEGIDESRTQQRKNNMILFTTDNWTVNLENMLDFGYTLVKITPELAAGDIYDIELTINMIGDDCYHVDDLDEIEEFDRLIRMQDGVSYGNERKDLSYYVRKLQEYTKTKEGNVAE